MRLSLALVLGALAAAPAALPAATGGVPARAPEAAPVLAGITRLAFAAVLAEQPVITAPAAWRRVDDAQAWAALSRAGPSGRQGARWTYVRSLIGSGRGAEAFGILETMRQDDPDLVLVPSFRLAWAATLVQMRRAADAAAELSASELRHNAEACAWRLRALAAIGRAEQAVGELACARPALNARTGSARAPFVLAAAQAALDAGKPALALQLLAQLPDRHATANLHRGRAYVALGRAAEARLRLARAEQAGTMAERAEARLSQIEAAVAGGSLASGAALKQLDALCFVWRGDHVEERALRLAYRLSVATGDLRSALRSGARLFRFFEPVRQGAGFVQGLQAQLAYALDPANGLPLEQAAGLFWEYRDLVPGGAEGNLIVSRLAERLQAAGLYGRAADLLEHQLLLRTHDLAQGPLSVRVAMLHLLAGRPERALAALRKTGSHAYPDGMIFERRRVEAAALSHMGRTLQALGALEDVPDAAMLRAEILWRRRDWVGAAREMEGALPVAGPMRELDQVVVLRYAISLAMLGREESLRELRESYADRFATLPTAAVFDMLTAPVGSADPASAARAMALLPSASPAGELGEVLETAAMAARPSRGAAR